MSLLPGHDPFLGSQERSIFKLLEENALYTSSLRSVRGLEKRLARYLTPETPIDSQLRARLYELGYEKLYTHQALAYEAAMRGEDVMLLTSTGSGKSLCYHLPILQTCLCEQGASALYLFPTKALAQDQYHKLREFTEPLELSCATYDGDTPVQERAAIRGQARILLTNPDMLHISILPQHEKWLKFLRSLKWIVVDEMHSYGGVFGSHVACILRRLLRLCEWHKAYPGILGGSATIANPAELFKQLTGRGPTLINQDGAPSSARQIVLCAPRRGDSGSEVSTNLLAAEFLAKFCKQGIRTLAFCRTRVSTELVLQATRDRLSDMGQPEDWVESYRGGYTPGERRSIQQLLIEGKIRGLVTTNAMELGIDVGDLDAVILNGYPGSISSFWQQIGRVGRGNREGFAIMLAQADPLEQYLVRYPDLLFEVPPECVTLNPENPYVLDQQILCAAYERALSPVELEVFGTNAIDIAESCEGNGLLDFRMGCFYYTQAQSPAQKVNIRGLGGENVVLYHHDKILGLMEGWRAYQNAYPGAVYLHRGQSYLIQELDLERRYASLIEHSENYYTRVLIHSIVEPKRVLREKEYAFGKVALMRVTLTSCPVAYQKISLERHSVVEVVDLEVLPFSFDTVAVGIYLPEGSMQADVVAFAEGVHGVEHAMLSVAPLFAGCEKNDLGSSWYVLFGGSTGPMVFIFDNFPGGVGLSEKLYAQFPRWARCALDLLRSCPCEEGCPGCLMSAKCEIGNQHLGKSATVSLLEKVVHGI
jgi:DEAD/DEAH box helicase domain-containing protein